MKKDNSSLFPMMAFTFFYAVVIYLLFLSFNYWSSRSDSKEAKE